MQLYKKINLFNKKTGEYICSTNQSRTCKEAKLKYFNYYKIEVKAEFCKNI